MAPPPDQDASPEPATPGSMPGRLGAALRLRWTSAHPRLEVRSITISGAEVFGEHVAVSNGAAVPIEGSLVPFGARVGWSIVVFVDDVTDAPMEGLAVDVEFNDVAGHRIVRPLCGGARAEANRAVQLRSEIDAPGLQDEDE